jgi:hypothetical protein
MITFIMSLNHSRVTSPYDLAICFAGTQHGNSYGFGGGFLWVRIMEDEKS